ncbi:MAG: Regulatory protein ArsR [Methanothrix harundinacea]|uniref:Regulatory protein ArsR n=1 Tax=Methanothrix harundinacea TaxID=301375 RepID=A0A101ILS6_9EURY|nr:MAG: Regulatory protein ArsR [Methanothrix harundinacea]
MISPSSDFRLSDMLIKALASDKRLNILIYLILQRKTVTALSKELNIPKSTTYDNLVVLIDSGLVKKNKGNKWVYYELTAKGREIIQNIALKSKINPY